MKYLITVSRPHFEVWYTNWYDYVNNYDADAGMYVFNLHDHTYTTNGVDWNPIPEDHL